MAELSPGAQELRERLYGFADKQLAIDITNFLVDKVNDTINGMHVNVSTSLLARTLLAGAILRVAGLWWSDMKDAPPPLTWEAIHSFITDPPADIDSDSWNPKKGEKPDARS